MFSIQELADTCFLPQGAYHLSILQPEGTPAHRIVFSLERRIYSAQVITEHGEQKATCLRLSNRGISWRQLGGTSGTEMFQYDIEIFPGGFLQGKCYRVDVPDDEAPPSPVKAEPVR